MGITKLIFVLVIAFVGWFLYRKFVSDAQKLVKRNEEKRKTTATGATGTLVKDPETGEYKVKRPEED